VIINYRIQSALLRVKQFVTTLTKWRKFAVF